jgi:hypothetical protein
MKHEFVDRASGEKYTFVKLGREAVQLSAQVGDHGVYLRPLVVFKNKDGVEVQLDREAPWIQDKKDGK